MSLTLHSITRLLRQDDTQARDTQARAAIDHAANDARIARCYGEPAESVAAFRSLNQSGYASLLKRVEAAEQRDGYWPPAAPSALTPSGYWPDDDEGESGAFEALVERVWRFVTRPEVFIVITAMSALLIGMKMIGGD